jgi:hypothetical protein
MSYYVNPANKIKLNLSYNGLTLLMAAAALLSVVAPAQAQDKKPNIAEAEAASKGPIR